MRRGRAGKVQAQAGRPQASEFLTHRQPRASGLKPQMGHVQGGRPWTCLRCRGRTWLHPARAPAAYESSPVPSPEPLSEPATGHIRVEDSRAPSKPCVACTMQGARSDYLRLLGRTEGQGAPAGKCTRPRSDTGASGAGASLWGSLLDSVTTEIHHSNT